jgi:hypothetical protein
LKCFHLGAAAGMLGVVLLLPLSSTMDNSEFDNNGGGGSGSSSSSSGSGGGGGDIEGVQWWC